MAGSRNRRPIVRFLPGGGGHAYSRFRTMKTKKARFAEGVPFFTYEATEHKLPSLCAKQAFSLFQFSRLKARWAVPIWCCAGFTRTLTHQNMKTKTIILIVVSLIPLTAFSQPPNP